ncbi:MAG TPA: tRNA-dihydrouridine synthase [bacterium]|nr:tRNA-dihydrouridine synthase [bacterium]
MSFWQELLQKPIIGLSPMDGVTDAPYRYIQKKYGNPDVIFTEFVSVDGIMHGSKRLMEDFIFDEIERPIVAQVFGTKPELFFRVAHVICELGFDGIDINMGCPARSVSSRGAGAALILTPKLAKRIVLATKKGVESWVENGIKPAKLKPKVRRVIQNMNSEHGAHPQANEIPIPVSVKTRVGYDKKIAADWVRHLTEVDPAIISIHGRTLKQMYTGEADWEQIGRAVESTDIPILGNGDVKSSDDAVRMIKETGCAGVLIGRASFGNPWIFKEGLKVKDERLKIRDYAPSMTERIKVVIEHARLHWDTKGSKGFVQMRKNLAWYFKGFEGASKLREKLIRVDNIEDVEKILSEIKS